MVNNRSRIYNICSLWFVICVKLKSKEIISTYEERNELIRPSKFNLRVS